MKRMSPTKEQGMQTARMLKLLLQKRGFPVQKVLLFGSVAKGETHEWSDIDIAVVHDAFHASRMEEMRSMCKAERGSDLRNIEVVYFHPDDLNDKYSAIVQEVKKHGIPV